MTLAYEDQNVIVRESGRVLGVYESLTKACEDFPEMGIRAKV